MRQIHTKERYQIDLIGVKRQQNDNFFVLALAVKSHGRFNHLLNMMLQRQALALTDNGLQIVFECVVSTDLNAIAHFFGFPCTIFD